MSLEQHVFIRTSRIPTRDEWQARIRELGLQVELYSEMNVGNDSGFSPCTINGQKSGFEIYFGSSQAALDACPDIRETVGDRDYCVTFRWGGDLTEYACVMAASAALVKFFDAVAYYPDGAQFYSADELQASATEYLEECSVPPWEGWKKNTLPQSLPGREGSSSEHMG